MSLTSYRAAPPRGMGVGMGEGSGGPGGDLLFRRLSGSTIGAEGFHGRVRDGIGCLAPRHGHQAVQAPRQGQGELCVSLSVFGVGCRVRLSHGAARLRRTGFAAARGRGQAGRAISTGQLRGLPRFHLRPIDVVVCHGS